MLTRRSILFASIAADGRLLNRFPVWVTDAAIRKKILVDNPARLYGL
jgi:hypothetical protein